MADIFTIVSGVLPDGAHMMSFRGRESLGRPYRFDLFVTLDAADFDRTDAVGAKATLKIGAADATPYVFHGVLTSVALLHAWGTKALYRLTLVPEIWLLSQSRHSRIFTKKSVVDVIKEVLAGSGMAGDEVELRLDGDYPAEEHICQYQESDLDFIHRWMELEGIYYFFEQGDFREKCVFTDHRSFHQDQPSPLLPFQVASHSGRASRQAIDGFTSQHRSLPASLKITDYDYARPQLGISASASVSSIGQGEVTIHNARCFAPDAAGRYAKLRAEELVCRESPAYVTGTALHLRPGYVFELDDHPVPRYNKRYLCTEISHFGNQSASAPELRELAGVEYDDVYRVNAAAIAADVQFRPRRVAAWPRVHGYELGVIDGPADSEYAQIDDQGRYAVKFRFDESSLKDGQASTFVRMLQPHGGTIEGWHFPLRKGTEIVFTFLGGDPDRPAIAGVAPNALTPSPVTSTNHTTNIVQTGGRNRLEMEDQDGGQRFTLLTPTEGTMLRMGAPNDDCNVKLTTEGNGRFYEKVNFQMRTHGPKKEEARDAICETFKKNFSTTVTDGKTTEVYNATKSETVTGDLKQIYKNTQTTTVTGLCDEIYSGKHETEVGGASTEQIDGAVTETYKGTQSTTVNQKVTETFNGGYDISVGATMTHTVTGTLTQTFGDLTENIAFQFKKKLHEEKGSISANSETYIGLKNENLVGGKIEILFGGLKMEGTLAVIVKMGAVACVIEPVDDEKSPVHAESQSAEAETVGTETENAGAADVESAPAQVDA